MKKEYKKPEIKRISLFTPNGIIYSYGKRPIEPDIFPPIKRR